MRSFIASVVVIAGVLIGQQWAAKANETHVASMSAATAAITAWMTDAR